MRLTIRLDHEKDKVEIGNDDIGFGEFEGSSKELAWAQRFAEYLEGEGIEVDVEESEEEEKPKKRR